MQQDEAGGRALARCRIVRDMASPKASRSPASGSADEVQLGYGEESSSPGAATAVQSVRSSQS